MNIYQTLGVDQNSSPDDIKRAYRKLANTHHPDKGGDVKKFQEIQKAYDTLSDPVKKAQYDMGGNGPQININNPFEFFNFNGFGNLHARRQQFFTVTMPVSLEQVATGDTEHLNIHTPTGPTVVQIEIPRGVEDGQQYKYQGVIPDTVLHIIFRIKRHPKFERTGLDLQTELTLDFLQLVTGTKVEIEDISNNKIEVNVPPMTKPGTRLRIPGRGLTSNYGKGDQYVLINGALPDKISDQLKNSIQQEVKENTK